MKSPRVRLLYVRAHLARARMFSSGPDLTWFRTASRHPELNGVLLVTRSRVSDALKVMGGRSALWHSWPEEPSLAVGKELSRNGLVFVEEEPLMVRAHPDLPSLPTLSPEFSVERVEDLAGLADWAQVWSPRHEDGLVPALATVGLGPGRRVHHLLGRLGGVPVASSAAVVTQGGIAVEHVVTLPSYRGRGFGTALTRAAVEVGARRGVACAVLTASPEGEGVYRRLGFRTVDRVQRFAPVPTAQGGVDAGPASLHHH